MLAGMRAIAAAVAMVSASCAAVAQTVPPAAQIVPPSDQPGRERERFERPPVPLAQPGGPAIAVPGIEAPPGRPRPRSSSAKFASTARPSTPPSSCASSTPTSSATRSRCRQVYDLAGRITAKYGADGYVLSRAIIPVQELDPNGAVVRIEVVEGYIETVEWPAAARRLS